MTKKDSELLEKGRKRLAWARVHSRVLGHIAGEMKANHSLEGLNIGMALHVEAKTGILALSLREAGAEVKLASCNPLSTDDSVATALREHHGLPVFAKKGEASVMSTV